MVSVRADGFGRRRTTFFCPNEEKNTGKIDCCPAEATCKKDCREKACTEEIEGQACRENHESEG